jgi:tRNA A-37 threonylcarbamoyl transferase component Bud32
MSTPPPPLTEPLGLEAGTVLGDWRIDGPIGMGGMGAVYSATHTMIGKRAAIKVVRADLCGNPLTTERFIQEARVVNKVRHGAIVEIFDIGTLEDGRPYLVMELLQGKTLGQRMLEGRVPPVEVIDHLLAVCDGLEAAHACGVVHRDLKPDNIFLAESAAGVEVKLVDWGIAKLMDVLPSSGTLTTTGTLVGTPQYMSPEQARGKAIDGRTDVYALGAIAYELFLEGPPFSADNVADLVTMQLREAPPPPSEVWPDIPSALESLLLAMLAKRPEGRPSLEDIRQTLRGLRAELAARRCISTRMRPLSAPIALAVLDRAPTWGMAPAPVIVPAADTGPTRKALRRRPVIEALAALGTFLLLAAAGVTVTQLGRDPGVIAAAARAGRGPIPAPAIAVPSVAGAPVEATLVPAVRAPDGDRQSVLDLRVEPGDAIVHIGGATIRAVDGRVVHAIEPGELVIVVAAPGHATYRRTLEVGPGTVLLEVELRSSRKPKRPLQHVPESRRPVLDIDPDGTIPPFE